MKLLVMRVASEFVGPVGTEQDLELEERRVRVAAAQKLSAIVVVLEPQLAELARVITEHRRVALAAVAQRVGARVVATFGRLETLRLAERAVEAQTTDPGPREPPEQLRVQPDVVEPRRRRQRAALAEHLARSVAAQHGLGLPGQERPALIGRERAPFQVKVCAIDAGLRILRAGIGPEQRR